MAGARDSARFFLEQSLPELRELERKGIFSEEEVTVIASRRSDFEHKVNGPGAKPTDFARYAEFEMNLESLREKRLQRHGSRKQGQPWQRRTMAVMGRATRRFPGDMSLWMQYAELARKQNSFKQLSKILTSMVRLHPTTAEAWIYAATYAMGELGDMNKARSYMQRGLRFCKDSQSLWLEFGRLEMAYLAKIYARRAILGVDIADEEPVAVNSEDTEADMIALPTVTAEELTESTSVASKGDSEVLSDPRSTPALSGAIPIAIFEAAMDRFKNDTLGGQFFDMVANFPSLPCTVTIMDHILGHFKSIYPMSAVTHDAQVRRILIGIGTDEPEFPQALAKALQQLSTFVAENISVTLLLRSFCWIASYLTEQMDAGIQEVLEKSGKRLLLRIDGSELEASTHEAEIISSLKRIRLGERPELADEFIRTALKSCPGNIRLLALHKERPGA